MTVEDIEEHVLIATPLVNCRGVLGGLERAKRVSIPNPPAARRKAAFNHPRMMLRFPPLLPGVG